MKLPKLLGVLCLTACVAVGCKDTPTTPTTATTANLQFASQLAVKGSTSRSFESKKAGDAKIVFNSLSPDTGAAITISLGTFDGTTCTPTATVLAAGGGSDAVMTTTIGVGMYCIRVSDPGVLTRTNDFYITLTVPAGS